MWLGVEGAAVAALCGERTKGRAFCGESAIAGMVSARFYGGEGAGLLVGDMDGVLRRMRGFGLKNALTGRVGLGLR